MAEYRASVALGSLQVLNESLVTRTSDRDALAIRVIYYLDELNAPQRYPLAEYVRPRLRDLTDNEGSRPPITSRPYPSTLPKAKIEPEAPATPAAVEPMPKLVFGAEGAPAGTGRMAQDVSCAAGISIRIASSTGKLSAGYDESGW